MWWEVFAVKSQLSFYCLLRIAVSNFEHDWSCWLSTYISYLFTNEFCWHWRVLPPVLVSISAGWFHDKTLLLAMWFKKKCFALLENGKNINKISNICNVYVCSKAEGVRRNNLEGPLYWEGVPQIIKQNWMREKTSKVWLVSDWTSE